MKMQRLLGLWALFWASGLCAKIGCMDNSWHLKQPFDTKSYHHVACNCPCDAWKAKGLYAPNKHRCLECGHAHLARPVKMLAAIPVVKGPSPELPVSLQAIAHRFRLLTQQLRHREPALFDNKKQSN